MKRLGRQRILGLDPGKGKLRHSHDLPVFIGTDRGRTRASGQKADFSD